MFAASSPPSNIARSASAIARREVHPVSQDTGLHYAARCKVVSSQGARAVRAARGSPSENKHDAADHTPVLLPWRAAGIHEQQRRKTLLLRLARLKSLVSVPLLKAQESDLDHTTTRRSTTFVDRNPG